jgi:hypothetical protein
VVDREPPGSQVHIRRSIDVELLGSPGSITVPLLFNLITDRCGFRVIDKAQTFVALANPFS